ncbi:hypothetical protein [Saccharopolyspora griseoalba]|uniref:Uncharacterized protein n=1 Tax=Saccharopolyspora griseoalba TaxID=1431848 RepID=A0ABW2LR31_9PSEU
MNPSRWVVLIAGLALASSGCFGTAEEKPAPAPPPTTQQVEPAPAPAEAPADNCALDPADMDAKTKAQCGLPVGEPSTQTSGATTPPEGDAQAPEDDSSVPQTDPDSPLYQQYREQTGYPYSEQQYDQLPGYQQCGTACGKEPTSGEVQQQWGCEQGYITEGC